MIEIAANDTSRAPLIQKVFTSDEDNTAESDDQSPR